MLVEEAPVFRILGVGEEDKPARISAWEGAENDSLDHTEDGRVRADASRESKNRCRRESWRFR